VCAMPSPRSDKGKHYRDMGRAATSGTLMVACVLIGYLGGEWLDSKLNTEPVLMVVGVILGMVAGFVELIQMVRRIAGDGTREGD